VYPGFAETLQNLPIQFVCLSATRLAQLFSFQVIHNLLTPPETTVQRPLFVFSTLYSVLQIAIATRFSVRRQSVAKGVGKDLLKGT
jgi:hypothetical protein